MSTPPPYDICIVLMYHSVRKKKRSRSFPNKLFRYNPRTDKYKRSNSTISLTKIPLYLANGLKMPVTQNKILAKIPRSTIPKEATVSKTLRQ